MSDPPDVAHDKKPKINMAATKPNTILNGLFEKLEYENEDLNEFDEAFAEELNKEIDSLFQD